MENTQPHVSDEPDYMTVKQAARHINVSPERIYRLCMNRKLSHYRFGEGRGAMRIRRMDLLDSVRRCRIERQEKVDGARRRRKSPVEPVKFYSRHLDLEPHHECGAMTKAGTPCKRMTPDERCPQHRAGPSGQ